MKLAALIASIAALAVSTGSLLAPQAASALDFTFSFDGVSGLIQNLAEGNNICDGTDGCVVTVETAPAGLLTVGTYDRFSGSGFFVSSAGVIETADWLGGRFGAAGGVIAELSFGESYSVGAGGASLLFDAEVAGPVTFAAVQPPASSVPGPLPLFGAAAAFGFSSKLRNRIKVTRTTAPTRPAG